MRTKIGDDDLNSREVWADQGGLMTKETETQESLSHVKTEDP